MKNEVFHDLFELSYGSKHEKKSLAQYHVLQFNSHYIKRIIVKNFFKKWNVKVRKENSVIQRGFKDFNRNYEYRTRNETISAKSPVASARANPRIAYENSCPLRAGFRAVDEISDEKICPIPIPAPVSPIAASPAPMYFAAANMVELSCIYVLLPIYENI
jgi:hypothetical protein